VSDLHWDCASAIEGLRESVCPGLKHWGLCRSALAVHCMYDTMKRMARLCGSIVHCRHAAECYSNDVVSRHYVSCGVHLTSYAEPSLCRCCCCCHAAIARQACRDIGYTSLDLGFDADSAEVKVLVQQQVPEIAQVSCNESISSNRRMQASKAGKHPCDL
jgi:hypothetical protein